jgi:hypothetical protein
MKMRGLLPGECNSKQLSMCNDETKKRGKDCFANTLLLYPGLKSHPKGHSNKKGATDQTVTPCYYWSPLVDALRFFLRYPLQYPLLFLATA